MALARPGLGWQMENVKGIFEGTRTRPIREGTTAICLSALAYVYSFFQAKHNKEKEYKQLALEHFDHYHQHTFDERWPSIRLALLSQQKYSVIVNNYSNNCEQIGLDLIGEGSYDIIKLGIEKHKQISNERDTKVLRPQNTLSGMNLTDIENLENDSDHMKKSDLQSDILELEDDRTDLYRFVPAEKVYTDAELFTMEEHQANILEPGGFDVKIIPETDFRLPNLLKVFTQSMGEVVYFSPPKTDGAGKLGKLCH
jgi:hypothetical protein